MFQSQQLRNGSVMWPDYIAIAGHLNASVRTEIAGAAKKYDSLQDAYNAYEKLLTEGDYKQYKDTLPQ